MNDEEPNAALSSLAMVVILVFGGFAGACLVISLASLWHAGTVAAETAQLLHDEHCRDINGGKE